MGISEEDDNFDVVNPKASNMIEALRDIGYPCGSAVADIIDNSISAEASRIDIRFGLADKGLDDPWLAIADNGTGMSDGELVEAMRPGGRDPLAKRKSDDLGRFGLGLKTASFSQCRKITVVSRKGGGNLSKTVGSGLCSSKRSLGVAQANSGRHRCTAGNIDARGEWHLGLLAANGSA